MDSIGWGLANGKTVGQMKKAMDWWRDKYRDIHVGTNTKHYRCVKYLF